MIRRIIIFALLLAASIRAADGPHKEFDYNLFLQGRYVYERNCIVCHGMRGDGNGELGKGLNPRPRSFREGMFKFRTTPWDKMPTDDDLRHTITHGLSGTAMGMFTQLRDEDVTALIEYVKGFSRRWRHEENFAEPLTFPAPPSWVNDEQARKPHIETGKVLFKNICATCHGENADGKGPTAPALKDIWGLPALPADLRQPHLRCGDSADDIFRILTTGMNGTPMISYDGTLSPEQRWQVIAYIMSIRVAGPDLLNPSSPEKKR